MQELLVKAGLPKDLLGNIGTIGDYPELSDVWIMLTRASTTRVVLVYGQPTPLKEKYCAVLLKGLMEWRKKKGLWLTPTRVPATQWGEGAVPFPPAGVTVVVGMDMLSPQQVKILVGHIRDQIPEDRSFILEISSKTALEESLGRVASGYLYNYAIAVDLNTKRIEPITITVA